MTSQLLQPVVLQVESFESSQPLESVVAEGDNIGVVEEEVPDAVPAQEVLLVDVSQVVPVQVDVGGIHGDLQEEKLKGECDAY